MRKFINIICENQLDQSTISDAYMIVSRYVTHGEWTTPTQFDKPLYELMNLLPRPDHSMELYRVIRLTDEQLVDYRSNRLVLEPRRFSSWTKNFEIAHRLAQSKGDNCIIVRETFSPEHIVVDVMEFYHENDLANFEFTEYFKYVVAEEEVIVYNSDPIRVTPENSKWVETPDHHPPMIGDEVFVGDSEDSVLIDDVDYDQRFAQRGIYSITTEYGDSYFVRNIGANQWETVDEIQESIQN